MAGEKRSEKPEKGRKDACVRPLINFELNRHYLGLGFAFCRFVPHIFYFALLNGQSENCGCVWIQASHEVTECVFSMTGNTCIAERYVILQKECFRFYTLTDGKKALKCWHHLCHPPRPIKRWSLKHGQYGDQHRAQEESADSSCPQKRVSFVWNKLVIGNMSLSLRIVCVPTMRWSLASTLSQLVKTTFWLRSCGLPRSLTRHG